MDAVLMALEQSPLAAYLRTARWEYAAVNAAHILGVAMLVGSILPLDLRLIGLWPSIERQSLARVLIPMAASGLMIAVLTGVMLFIARAQEYATLSVLWLKLTFIVIGFLSAIVTHLRHGLWLDRVPNRSIAHVGVLSLVTWLSALVCGRLIAFVV